MKLFLHIANFKLMRTYNGTLLGKFNEIFFLSLPQIIFSQ